jgi:DNA-binding response OmpR family regulator
MGTVSALIVEDEPDMADVLARILRLRHIDSTVMHAGDPAPAFVRTHHPDVVLLDLMLPDRDGYSVCEEIKLDRDTNLTPIVMVTAMGRHEDLIKGLAVGANEYLSKPFEIEELNATVDRALAWREEMKRCGACHEVHFQLKSDTRLLTELNDMLTSLLLYTPLSADAAHQLTTAVREMGGNAIEWGHRKRVELLVTVTYRIQADRVVVTIKDTGPGFNRGDLAHAADIDDPVRHIDVRESLGLRVGGFGILMTKGLVDEMEYNRAGNEVRLAKYFEPKSSTTGVPA